MPALRGHRRNAAGSFPANWVPWRTPVRGGGKGELPPGRTAGGQSAGPGTTDHQARARFSGGSHIGSPSSMPNTS